MAPWLSEGLWKRVFESTGTCLYLAHFFFLFNVNIRGIGLEKANGSTPFSLFTFHAARMAIIVYESYKIQEWLIEFTVAYHEKVWATRLDRFVLSVVKYGKEKKILNSSNLVEVWFFALSIL